MHLPPPSIKIPLVIASTGHTDEEKNKITETAEKIPVFFSYNMSVGIAALCEMVKKAARFFRKVILRLSKLITR